MTLRQRVALLGLWGWCAPILAGSSGPTVGNPDVNEAAEEPAQKSAVSARRMASPASSVAPYTPYGAAEVRHVMNDYFDQEGRRIRRDPALHGRFQIGSRFYYDRLDVSAAVGAVKMPQSQSFYQKRPEVLVDIYPLRGPRFNVLWYHALEFPVREKDRDPSEFADADRYERDSLRGIDATVYTMGLAPVWKSEWQAAGGKYQVRLGADGWTKLYSKPLYIDETNESGGKGVGLVSDEEDPLNKRFEDHALRYVHQESLAVGWSPSFAPMVTTDLGAHIESRYLPRYYRDESGGWAYVYEPERVSFWRARLGVDLTASTSLHNEFFVFRNGFFAENRVDQERRFRNVVKLSVKL